jgi:hypothetical protein
MNVDILDDFPAFEKRARVSLRKRSERSDWLWEEWVAEVLGLHPGDHAVGRIGTRIRQAEGPYLPTNYRDASRVERVVVTFFQEAQRALRPSKD